MADTDKSTVSERHLLLTGLKHGLCYDAIRAVRERQAKIEKRELEVDEIPYGYAWSWLTAEQAGYLAELAAGDALIDYALALRDEEKRIGLSPTTITTALVELSSLASFLTEKVARNVTEWWDTSYAGTRHDEPGIFGTWPEPSSSGFLLARPAES